MSLPLSSVVTTLIDLSSPGIGRPGFGKPLVLSNTGNAWATPELTRTYTKGSYFDDFAVGTVERAALDAIFAQPSPPDEVAVGKGPTKPTMVRTVQVSSAVEGATYTINVWCNGTLWSAEYVAEGGDSTTDIATALRLQLTPAAWVGGTSYALGDRVLNDTGKLYQATQAGLSELYGTGPTGTDAAITDGTVIWEYVVTPNFTAANSATDTITATGSAAGNWFALEPLATGDVEKVSNVMVLTDTTTDPSGTVAADLDQILSADSTWYALVLLFKSKAILSTPATGVSAWCAANERLLVVAVSDTICATGTLSTNVLRTLKAQGSSYTAGQWHPRDYEFLDACTDGYFLPIEPGGDNWRMKTLTGPTRVNLTPTQVSNLDGCRAGYYSDIGDVSVLAGGGYVMSTTYGFIDNRRNIDWYRVNLQVDLVNLVIQDNKVPNTTAGRRLIASTIASRNMVGIQKGVISPDPLDPENAQTPVMEPFTVTVPPVTDESSFDPVTRALSGIETRWKLASPVNSMDVTVHVTQ